VANNLARFQRWAKRATAAVTGWKRTEITVETTEVLIIRRRSSIRFWCPECGREVEMVNPKDAGMIPYTAWLPTHNGAQAGKWHFCQGPDGSPLICLESLRKSL